MRYGNGSVVDSYDVALVRKTLDEAFTTGFAGLKVIVAEGECQLERQRRVLEARALIDAGREELALDLLAQGYLQDAAATPTTDVDEDAILYLQLATTLATQLRPGALLIATALGSLHLFVDWLGHSSLALSAALGLGCMAAIIALWHWERRCPHALLPAALRANPLNPDTLAENAIHATDAYAPYLDATAEVAA